MSSASRRSSAPRGAREPRLRPAGPLERDDREHRVSIAVLCGGLGGSRCVDALTRAPGPRQSPRSGTSATTSRSSACTSRPTSTRSSTRWPACSTRSGAGASATRPTTRSGWPARSAARRGSRSAIETSASTSSARAPAGGRAALGGDGASSRRPSASASELLPRPTTACARIVTDARGGARLPGVVRRARPPRPSGARPLRGPRTRAAAPGVLDAIADAELVVIAPSNPFVSIEPILAVPGNPRGAARRSASRPISPLVGGKAFRGPLAEMLRHSATSRPPGVARLYGDLVDTFVVDGATRGRRERSLRHRYG